MMFQNSDQGFFGFSVSLAGIFARDAGSRYSRPAKAFIVWILDVGTSPAFSLNSPHKVQ